MSKKFRAKRIRAISVNRFIWVLMFVGVCIGAWFSGERILFLAATILFALPIISYIYTYFLLRGIKVSRSQPDTIMKNAKGTLTIHLHNTLFMPLGGVEVSVNADEHAITILENQTIPLNPFAKETLKIPFQTEFRGYFNLGLDAIRVMDITGLFKLKREFDGSKMILSLPHVAELSHFPLSMNLMTQASSRYDIRDEDYTTISDIRQYLPTDSIKRVHWKLTAKRNEWLVKNFQSNALNLVSIILDTARVDLPKRESYALEDSMVENALGLAKFCLTKGMPVNFITTQKISARNAADFEAIYQAASNLEFSQDAVADCHSMLAQELTEATGVVNAVIMTSHLDAPQLYERVISGTNNGHYIAVLYFPKPKPDFDADEIFRLLTESSFPCYKIEQRDDSNE
ncbi:MAG: DUF58 domain-containing protein [Defluviitaleaceae bacterium]|nr:DUF58 domain-containing protein [Defluviitaleaceae bacterium]